MKPLKTLGLSLALTTTLALPALADHPRYGNRGGEAIIYSNSNFTGRSLRVTGPIPRLADYRFNDKASSIRVTGGAWEVCVDANYRGRCEVVEFHEGRLNEVRLNNKITSIRPVNYGYRSRNDRYDRHDRYGRDNDYNRGNRYGYGARYNAPLVLYQDPNFRGNALPINGAVPSLGQLRFNDKTSSIAIQSGAWEVCTDGNFRGRCEIVTGSMNELGYVRLNDKISSIRPAGRGYGYDRDRGRRW
ncbi:beta/gamma crystallin-related protein [Henriciella sp. AS95]|uniref:beta/gamma crystallin-related protein n=1 Tax=Henriciella sp. AS95 TaxID=3135782 RepID=UPI0031781DA7